MALEKYYKLTDISKQLGVSRVTAYNWVKTGKLKAKMIGNSYKVAERELDRFLKTLEA